MESYTQQHNKTKRETSNLQRIRIRDTRPPKPRSMDTKTVPHLGEIDRGECSDLRAMFSSLSVTLTDALEIELNDEERRVKKIVVRPKFKSRIHSIPPSIGKLKYLEELDLERTKKFVEAAARDRGADPPEEINPSQVW